MNRFIRYLALLALAPLLVGCEDLPSDPTPSQQIVGQWRASGSNVPTYFAQSGVTEILIEFQDDGDFSMTQTGGTSYNGTYVTAPTAITPQRSIELTGVPGSFVGLYSIVGTSIKLEIVPDPPPAGVLPPDVSLVIPSARRNSTSTTEFLGNYARE